MATSFRDLRTWQHSMDLAVCVYRHTESFPKHEICGLSQQMRRAAVSVASNIAEGKGRWTQKEFRQFLFHARGSLLELETQIEIAHRLEYLSVQECERLQQQAEQVGRGLAGLLNSLDVAAA
jgi:four helix bundle protein